MRACLKYDPRGILFGTDTVPKSAASVKPGERERITALLADKVGGKRILTTFGSTDKIVPYSASSRFLDFVCEANDSWAKGAGFTVQQKVYEQAGHEFTEEMIADALQFLTEEMKAGAAVRHKI